MPTPWGVRWTDAALVQEFLSLSPQLTFLDYKAPIAHLLRTHGYPSEVGVKTWLCAVAREAAQALEEATAKLVQAAPARRENVRGKVTVAAGGPIDVPVAPCPPRAERHSCGRPLLPSGSAQQQRDIQRGVYFVLNRIDLRHAQLGEMRSR